MAKKRVRLSDATRTFKPCPYCKHVYWEPCDETKYEKCPNWQYLQKKRKKERVRLKKRKK